MAQNTTISLAAGTWTLLTDGNVTALRVVNLGEEPIWLQATVGTTPPTTPAGALPLQPGPVLAADLTLAQLFPGVTGANRVYALAPRATSVSVSHA
jgi:hypothetical protein